MAALYIAQATNTPLDLWHQLTLLAVLLLTSKGAAGVTGSGFIVLAASLSASVTCRWRGWRSFSASTASCPRRAPLPISSATALPPS